jgi:hypothetical protein
MAEGELALNLADGVVYSKDCNGQVVQIAGGIPDAIDGGSFSGSAPTVNAPVTTQSTVTITQQPKSASHATGQVYGAGQVSVVATATAGTLTYQWQLYTSSSGWVAVVDGALVGSWLKASGATLSTLTLYGPYAPVTLRCVVATETSTPVISDSATLDPT